ncbi:TPA: helix-turn-helix transcriptional regulator, partial [Streptococcus equi subsp. equi]|nr:helix-turn-helix transcriptional regulator [Streptococcus equi subsp. equi]
TFYKMKNSENITTDVIVRICDSLNCGVNEIMELVDDENN